MKDPKKLAGWLALATLAAVVLAPPEAYGSGRMFLIVGATFAFLILASDGGVPWSYLAGGLATFALLVAHSLALSDDVFRSAEFLSVLWAYYCLFGFFYFNTVDMRKSVAVTLVLLGTAVSAYGFYQYVFGLEQLYNFVLYSGADEAVRIPILDQMESERVFSTFALPGTLWGFLILTIPLHGLLWQRGGGRFTALNALLIVNVLLILAATVLTQSYGLVVGLLILILGWFLTRGQRATLKPALLVGIGLLPIVVGIYAVRASTYNPVSLRIQNWMTAWEIFASHPWGSGLNSYAVLYLQHQQLGANETQFAHNTAAQLLAELGVIAVVLAIVGLFFVAKRYQSILAATGPRRWLLLALLVWIGHNLIEINVYFASIGAIGAALIALFAWTPGPDFSRISNAHANRLVQASLVAGLIAVLAGAGMYLSGELLYRSQIEIENRELETAADTLALAGSINPWDSSIFHEAGQVALELYHLNQQQFRIDDARVFFQRAIDLSPRKVGPHVGLSLSLSTLDRTEEALEQIKIAQRLHPAGTQSYAIRRLIERRHLELASGLTIQPPAIENE